MGRSTRHWTRKLSFNDCILSGIDLIPLCDGYSVLDGPVSERFAHTMEPNTTKDDTDRSAATNNVTVS